MKHLLKNPQKKSKCYVSYLEKPFKIELNEIKINKFFNNGYNIECHLPAKINENSIVGVKNITMNEPIFTGHFPGNPVFPGVLQIEAMAQTGGIFALSKVEDPHLYTTYFMKIDKVKFKQKVVPGDTVVFELHLLSPIRRGLVEMGGKAYVNGNMVMEAEMLALVTKDKE